LTSLKPRRGYLDVLNDDKKYKSFLGADIGNVSWTFLFGWSVDQGDRTWDDRQHRFARDWTRKVSDSLALKSAVCYTIYDRL